MGNYSVIGAEFLTDKKDDMPEYAIFVNTCDKFEDCWDPFFKLFSTFWPEYKGKIYLNTEYKSYSYGELNIIPLKIAEIKMDAHKITWSECLFRAITKIDEDIILYLQEDYFFKGFVKNGILENFVKLMSIESTIDCIHLTDQGPQTHSAAKFEGLWTVPKVDRDRISCQAALWKKNTLKEYIRTYETAWNFEWWGSKRAAILNHNIYAVNKGWIKKDKFEIIPYIFTGVIGGKWFKEVVPLFKENNIELDYSDRGFFKNPKVTLTKKIQNKINRLPTEIISSIDLLLLRIKN